MFFMSLIIQSRARSHQAIDIITVDDDVAAGHGRDDIRDALAKASTSPTHPTGEVMTTRRPLSRMKMPCLVSPARRTGSLAPNEDAWRM